MALVAGVAMAQQQADGDDAAIQRLSELVSNAEKSLSAGKTYVPVGVEPDGNFPDHGYVRLSYNDDTFEATINVICNAPELTEGELTSLADDDYYTYFHSNWSNFEDSEVPHNLIVDLGEGNSLSAIAVKVLKRNTSTYNANRAPTEWVVYGSNDDGDNKHWMRETMLYLDYSYDYTKIFDYDGYQYMNQVANGIGFGMAGLSQAYRYLRFDAVNNLNDEKNYFFALSEFGVWEAKLDNNSSTDDEVPQEVMDYLLAELENAKNALSNGTVTTAQVLAMQAAYEAYLCAAYAPDMDHPNLIYADDAEVAPGTTYQLPILLNNVDELTAFQFDLYLPDGITLATQTETGEESVNFEKTARLDESHEVAYSVVSDGAFRIIGYSLANATIEGNEGAILYLPITLSADATAAYHTISIRNIRLSATDKQVHKVEGITARILKGEADAPTATDPALYENVIYGEDIEICAGKEFVLPILMRNTEDIISFQVDLYLPEGITPKIDEEGYIVAETNNDRVARSFNFESTLTPQGYTRFICYSMRNIPIEGTEGEIFNVTLVADENLADGDYEISYKNTVMTKTDAKTAFEVEHVTSKVTVTSLRVGDVNGDGNINVSDVSSIVSILLNSDNPTYNKAADVNGDGNINVSDVSAIVNMLLAGQ